MEAKPIVEPKIDKIPIGKRTAPAPDVIHIPLIIFFAITMGYFG
jgi:hypothetical protein